MSTVFLVMLDGEQEATPNNSTASGFGLVVFDSEAVAATYSFEIEGLDFGPITTGQPRVDLNDVTNAHFHANVRGVSGGVVFGQITPNHDADDVSFVLNADGSWTVSGRWETTDPAPITGFNAVLGDTFANVLGSAEVGEEVPLYFNVHTVQVTGGEIRGQLVAIADDIDNVVAGTAGNNALIGGSGKDAILGLAGNDILSGGNNNDVLDGGGGNDVVSGGSGDDLMYGSTGNDFLNGNAGDDTMDGGSGNDVLNGGNGDDSMHGGADNDWLIGGSGDDTLNGGTGDDLLNGNSGADLFVFNVDFGDDVIIGFGNNDSIQFDDELFATPEAALAAAQQVGFNTVITAGTNSVTLLGVNVNSLDAGDFSIVA